MLRRPSAKTALRILGVLLAIGLVGCSVVYFWSRHASTHQPLPDPKVVVGTATGEPGETAVNTNTYGYNVAADKPKLIDIPSLGSKGFIQQVAIDTKLASMAVPSNVHFAGWYVKTAKPGDSGLSIINGHVSGRYQPGIFKDLAKLQPGATFYVTYGDGSRRNFVVVTNQTYPVEQVATHLYSKDPSIDKQLNLITCGGQYNKATRKYDKRVLVITKKV